MRCSNGESGWVDVRCLLYRLELIGKAVSLGFVSFVPLRLSSWLSTWGRRETINIVADLFASYNQAFERDLMLV